MKIKYLTIILAMLILVLSVCAVSATQDVDDTLNIKDNTQDNNVSVDQSVDEVKQIETKLVKTANESTSTTSNSTTKTVKKTIVSAPDTSFFFKRNSYFKFKIKDKTTKKGIKNLKISFKITDNKKTKTYTLKTNKNGVAKFRTKKLSLGYHKFVITSKDSNYKVSKKDRIFIGNLYYETINMGSQKKLKNGDALQTFIVKKTGQFKKGVQVDLWYTGGKNPSKASPAAKFTRIIKAKFFFKNKKTGKIVTVSSKGNLIDFEGELYRELPHVDLMKGYTPIKTKIAYLTCKK